MKQVHIVSPSPRTGTTLLMELMVHGFVFDGHADHELEVVYAPDPPVDRFCSKNPANLKFALPLLKRRPELWVICVLRDPRDVVVSRHSKRPEAYWAHFGFFRDRMGDFRAARGHERFLVVRYEDLVADPDAVQAELQAAIPFLEKRRDFSSFHEFAAPTSRAVEALGGVRAISADGIGRWKSELPRLKAQIERYGDIDELLIELGYERDQSWKRLLDGVEPDNGKSYFEDRSPRPLARRLKLRLRRDLLFWRAMLGFPAKHPIIVTPGGVREHI